MSGLAAAKLPAKVALELTQTMQPFFARHCPSCHGELKQKGNLRVDTLEWFAQFRDELRALKDGDEPLLDRRMILFGSGMSYGHRHANSNLPILLAGGHGLGLKHGQRHLRGEQHAKRARDEKR